MVEAILLSIAKTAILHRFNQDTSFDKEKLLESHPYLAQDGACFVTLHANKDLRGCIGSIIARRSLFDDIYHNAQHAAFSDPRFKPLQQTEFYTLELEISVLTPPSNLQYDSFEDLQQKIKPHIHGLILSHGLYRGTFLPQVWEQIPEPKCFLEQLSYKAGANPSIFSQYPEISIYEVQAISEQFNAILPL